MSRLGGREHARRGCRPPCCRRRRSCWGSCASRRLGGGDTLLVGAGVVLVVVVTDVHRLRGTADGAPDGRDVLVVVLVGGGGGAALRLGGEAHWRRRRWEDGDVPLLMAGRLGDVVGWVRRRVGRWRRRRRRRAGVHRPTRRAGRGAGGTVVAHAVLHLGEEQDRRRPVNGHRETGRQLLRAHGEGQ